MSFNQLIQNELKRVSEKYNSKQLSKILGINATTVWRMTTNQTKITLDFIKLLEDKGLINIDGAIHRSFK